jgi:hypothetical protein
MLVTRPVRVRGENEVFDVKTLPDRPSLDHLHRQAKDLLIQMRVSDPTLTLTRAQAVLAGQYGYRSWPDLKAEVDRRRAVARIADPAVLAAVAKEFGLGTPSCAMVAAERAWAGQVWTIVTDAGAWKATELFEWTPAGNVEQELTLVEAAPTAGILCPRPIRSRTGQAIAEIAGTRWRVHEQLKAGPPFAAPVAPATATAIGGTLGSLHALRLPAPGPVGPWLTRRRPDADWELLAALAHRAKADWAPRLRELLPAIAELSLVDDTRDADATAILGHCSLGPTSILDGGAAGLVVVGWEHAGAIPPAWELGQLLHTWGVDALGRRDGAAVYGIVDGYRGAAGGVPEISPAIFTSAVSGWLNWLATRIGIALDPKADEESRTVADREVPVLLARPLTRGAVEAMAGAAAEAAADGASTPRARHGS